MASRNERNGLRTWIEVDKKAIAYNYGVFRGLISEKTKLMAVVKSNAYGHGLIDFSKEIIALGADWLGVDSATEALAIRRAGIKISILILGYTLPEMIKEAVENDIRLTISSFEQLKGIEKIKTDKPKRIHIKVDTGMNRQGFLAKDTPKILSQLNAKRFTLNASVEGLFTHFASAKNPAFPQFTKKQIEVFEEWRKAFADAGLNVVCHASATAGALLYPEANFDMVRIGIGLYGLWPSVETKMFYQNRLELKPILAWKTIVSEVKKIPAGSWVGYDGTELMEKETTLAICPVGYWHGYPRALSSIGRVLIKNKEARVVGRVSMDMIAVDITGIKSVGEGDEVILIGNNPDSKISAEDISYVLDASWYELVTRINPLIKRIYY